MEKITISQILDLTNEDGRKYINVRNEKWFKLQKIQHVYFKRKTNWFYVLLESGSAYFFPYSDSTAGAGCFGDIWHYLDFIASQDILLLDESGREIKPDRKTLKEWAKGEKPLLSFPYEPNQNPFTA